MPKMGKYHPCRILPPSLGFIGLVLATVLAPSRGWGQQALWEQLINEGNRALALGALFEAETYYQQALQVADQFPSLDLRRPTTQRNLAQALLQQGRFDPADSLYRAAITVAARALEPDHPYVLSLRDELDRLHKAIAQAQRAEVGDRGPASFQDMIRNWALLLARNLALQLGPTLPLGGGLADTHDRGMGYGLSLRIPLTDLGPLSIGMGAEHLTTTLPALRAITAPCRLHGTTAALMPSLGAATLSLGAGIYAIETGNQSDTQPGLTGGFGLTIIGKRTQGGRYGLRIAVRARAVYFPNAAPVAEGAATLLQAGLELGWWR